MCGWCAYGFFEIGTLKFPQNPEVSMLQDGWFIIFGGEVDGANTRLLNLSPSKNSVQNVLSSQRPPDDLFFAKVSF